MNSQNRSCGVVFVLLLLAAVTVLVLGPHIGAISGNIFSTIYWEIRLPRALLAFLAGAGLSVSGMAFQAIFRNPLATPFTLGVASGASLGAALCVRLGVSAAVFGVSGISLFAFIGAVLSISLVYGVTFLKRGFSTGTMLLTGVAMSFFFSSLILFTQYLSDFTQSYRIMRWLMGGLEVVGFEAVLNVAPFVLSGMAIILAYSYELNLLMSGEDIAISRGVNADRVKRILFFATSLMVGGIVAECGPIGFIGMMSPHICRLLVGSNHRLLAPASILFGGVFLTACDIISRTLIAPAEIPVGIITALCGGPFFLWLLLSHRSQTAPAH
jgi:iron complex transport system permease protein